MVMNHERPTPQEVKRLQEKTGLNNDELAKWLHISVKSLKNAKSLNADARLTSLQYSILLLLTDEHPEYVISKKTV